MEDLDPTTILYCTARASGQFLIEWSRKQNAGIAGFFVSSLVAGFSQKMKGMATK